MLGNGVHIIGRGLESLTPASAPETLAAEHALWRLDMEALASWRRQRMTPGGKLPELYTSAVAHPARPVLLSGPCSSAMDVAWGLANEGVLPDWGSVLAVSQRSGRGQMRREWCSLPGNLYVAWLWPGLGEAWARLASLLAGYALCRALRAFVPELRIKWPNDLLHGEVKVGGVLVEERGERLLVGFGLNLAWAPDVGSLRAGAAVRAGCLGGPGSGLGLGPARLWLELLGPAADETLGIVAGGPDGFLRALEGVLAWRGLRVRVREAGGQETSGIILGLSDDGGLRLVGDEGELVLYSGSLIPLY